MRIVHVVYSLELGGAEVLVAQLCRLQRAHGHQVSLFAYSKLGILGEEMQAEGFPIYVPGEAHPGITMWRYLRRFQQLRPDVVHCHNPAPTLQAAFSAWLAGAGCVVSTRHSLVAPPYDRMAELKYNVMALFCDWIVGICEATCVNLRGTSLAAKSKIVRVYNGAAPVEPSLAACGQKNNFTILFVGRMAAVKDLETLLRAFALAREEVPKLDLWLVGDGPIRSDLELLARELGLREHVHLWGQQMETAPFFSAADVFAMSSKSEGLPMSLLQAMSIGLPTVATDVGGLAEILRIGECGLLVRVGDSRAMADALVTLATDKDLRTRFAERAEKAFFANFTLERMDAAYMDLYRRSSQDQPRIEDA